MMRAKLPSRFHLFVLHVAVLLLVLPVFAGLGYAFNAAVREGMGIPFSSTAPIEAKCVVGVVGLLALAAAILILWKGRVRIPLCVVGAAYLLLWHWLSWYTEAFLWTDIIKPFDYFFQFYLHQCSASSFTITSLLSGD